MIYVLDASSILRLLLGEEGGDRVKRILAEVGRSDSRALISVENWGEIVAKIYKAQGRPAAEALFSTFTYYGVEIVPLTVERVNKAAFFKIELKLPYADAICLELATSIPGALLVVADFDFVPVTGLVAIEFLPAKPKS